MKIKVLLIFVFVFLLAFPTVAFISQGERVETSAEAEAIALRYENNLDNYNNRYPDCEIIGTKLVNGVWQVGFGSTKEEYKYMAGGGFPVVFIDETNSRNITHLYQK